MNTPTNAIDDIRWQQVRDKDMSAEGEFVLAVKTTGIFCRVGCPARAPKRENIEFFDTVSQAIRAGYRPCKRCRPLGKSLAVEQQERITRACRLLESSDSNVSLDELAQEIGLSKFHFHRLFTQAVGLTPRKYAAAARTERLRSQLKEGQSVTKAIFDAGYSSSGQFYRADAGSLGMTPKEFADRGHGVSIRWTTAPCILGTMIIASTDKGICYLQFGDEPDQLQSGLHDEFPRATFVPADDALTSQAERIAASIGTTDQFTDIPLDVAGTALQLRVWSALRQMPAGTSTTYKHMAETVGHPKAIRAVASACAKNPVAIVIPCHRVVASDGSLAGYRSGIERKRILLDREAALAD